MVSARYYSGYGRGCHSLILIVIIYSFIIKVRCLLKICTVLVKHMHFMFFNNNKVHAVLPARLLLAEGQLTPGFLVIAFVWAWTLWSGSW